MKRFNIFYLVIGILLVVLVVFNKNVFDSNGAISGVTYSKRFLVNTERPSIIGETYAVPGQLVNEGDLLVDMASPELELEISTLQKEIEVVTQQIDENNNLWQARLILLEAESNLINEEAEAEIKLLQNQLDLNKSLTKRLLNENRQNTPADTLTDLQLQIDYLTKRNTLSLHALDLKIKEEYQKYVKENATLTAQLEIARQALVLGLQEKKRLKKYANFEGIVDSIFVKPGELLPAFAPIISMNSTMPASVIAYTPKGGLKNKKPGDSVTVQSLINKNIKVTGRIIGYGTVVEMPEILQKSTTIRVFGRELFIGIPEDNPFVVGERILIK